MPLWIIAWGKRFEVEPLCGRCFANALWGTAALKDVFLEGQQLWGVAVEKNIWSRFRKQFPGADVAALGRSFSGAAVQHSCGERL